MIPFRIFQVYTFQNYTLVIPGIYIVKLGPRKTGTCIKLSTENRKIFPGFDFVEGKIDKISFLCGQ